MKVEENYSAPFKVTCMSAKGQLIRISCVDFIKRLGKDNQTMSLLRDLYNHKMKKLNKTES